MRFERVDFSPALKVEGDTCGGTQVISRRPKRQENGWSPKASKQKIYLAGHPVCLLTKEFKDNKLCCFILTRGYGIKHKAGRRKQEMFQPLPFFLY